MATTEFLQRRLRKQKAVRAPSTAAKVNGEIIGTASLNRKSNRMSHRGVFGISLKKAWWGCGAASALMEAIKAGTFCACLITPIEKYKTVVS